MNKMNEFYQDRLLYAFTKQQHQLFEEYLIILKDGSELKPYPNAKVMHYSDTFESLLKIKLPTKIRKTRKLLSFQENYEILNKIQYGILTFKTEEYPYSIGLDHIIIDHHIYFHCATSGYKLKSINEKVSYMVVEDLQVSKEAGTHNHRSVAIFGQIEEVKDFDTKKAALLQLVSSRAPSHPYDDKMIQTTTILELKIDYMIGKFHIVKKK